MGFTFRKSVWVVPGFVKYNVYAHSRSWTYLIGPLRWTRSSTGARTFSVNLPGPFGYNHRSPRRR